MGRVKPPKAKGRRSAREKMVEDLRTVPYYEHTYASGHRVEVTNRGVTLWDVKDRRWLIDASTIARPDEDSFYVSAKLKMNTDGIHREFESRYPVERKRRKTR